MDSLRWPGVEVILEYPVELVGGSVILPSLALGTGCALDTPRALFQKLRLPRRHFI